MVVFLLVVLLGVRGGAGTTSKWWFLWWDPAPDPEVIELIPERIGTGLGARLCVMNGIITRFSSSYFKASLDAQCTLYITSTFQRNWLLIISHNWPWPVFCMLCPSASNNYFIWSMGFTYEICYCKSWLFPIWHIGSGRFLHFFLGLTIPFKINDFSIFPGIFDFPIYRGSWTSESARAFRW